MDIVHGHSSHHVRPIEVFEGRLILYGCGDLLDDYEGISGYEEFRDDLALMFFPSVDALTGRLCALHLTPALRPWAPDASDLLHRWASRRRRRAALQVVGEQGRHRQD